MEEVKGRKVLVAVDDSEQSLYALKWALDNLQFNSADTLILCHAKKIRRYYIYVPGFAAEMMLPPGLPPSADSQHRLAQAIVNRAEDICSESEVKVEQRILSGNAKPSICNAAEEFQADFLVVGSRGRGAFKRMLLGSVSDYCAHHAKCPVLIVKKPRDNS
eukprot:Gb_33366 [translate_table: standard]